MALLHVKRGSSYLPAVAGSSPLLPPKRLSLSSGFGTEMFVCSFPSDHVFQEVKYRPCTGLHPTKVRHEQFIRFLCIITLGLYIIERFPIGIT